MLGTAAAEVKELIRSRTDIVQLIGESLTLQPERGGRSYRGLCPFHPDHNPSLTVNPERQTYKCWACGEGGDCFSFVMKYEGVGFREALELLARRAGIELPRFAPAREEGSLSKQQLYEVLAWAEQECHRFLLQAQLADKAREYLRSRQFHEDTIRRFRLGYHPDDWQWLLERGRQKFPLAALQAAGLVEEREGRSGFRDKFLFVDRVVFPIHDERGRCVAFGGRQLPQTKFPNAGKYLNSDEGPLFHKSRLLYGLDHAREGIRRTQTAVVMEGYVDCIKAHQAGVVNAVATLGTALSETQVALLKRFAQRVVLVYDGDTAGRTAAERAIEKFLAHEVDIRILTLPDELDPDEFLEIHGSQELERLIATAPEAWEFHYRNCVAAWGTHTTAGRLRVLEEMLKLLTVARGMAGSVKENLLLSQLADRLRIPEPDVRRRLRALRGPSGTTVATRKVSASGAQVADEEASRLAAVVSLQQHPTKDDLLECELLQTLFTTPHRIGVVRQTVGLDDLRHPLLREVLGVCFDLADHGQEPEVGRVLATMECPHLKRVVVWLDEEAALRRRAETTLPPATGSDTERLQDILERIVWRRQQESYAAQQGKLVSQADSPTGLDADMRELLRQSAHYHRLRTTRRRPSS